MRTRDLFDREADASDFIIPNMPDGDVIYYRRFFGCEESDVFFEALSRDIRWKQEKIRLYGKFSDVPRLTAWHGDPGKTYAYSGLFLEPEAWTERLLEIKSRVEAASGSTYDSVLSNLYRDGRDGVSWHSDDEAELGENPIIASVSFGAARTFQLKHRTRPNLGLKLELAHGSLLLMKGATQHHWRHQVPKTKRASGPRINLTFRTIKR